MNKKVTLEGRLRTSQLVSQVVDIDASAIKDEFIAMQVEEQKVAEDNIDHTATLDELELFYRELCQSGTLQRRGYSIRERNNLLLTKLNQLLQQKITATKATGVNDDECREICQHYIDLICNGLKQRNIKISRIKVLAKRHKSADIQDA